MRHVTIAVVTSLVLVLLGAPADSQTVATATLDVHYQPPEEQHLPLLVDELAPETVLTIRATGFEASASGRVRQCADDGGRRCGNLLAVRFDPAGRAVFQYLVTASIGGLAGEDEPCRLASPRCTIELTSGDRTTVVDTVFVDAAPPLGDLAVEPSRGLVVGGVVTVTARGLPAGADVLVQVCADPSTTGRRCGPPGPSLTLRVGPDGSASTPLTLDVDEVGPDRVACGRRVSCSVVMTSPEPGVRARPVRLAFAGPPGADVGAGQLAVGLSAAALFAALAMVLMTRTRWAPPPESDSSPIDDAEFADLDREAAEVQPSSPAQTESTSPRA